MKTETENTDEKPVSSMPWVGHAWLVVGECGEYSDHQSWIVRGYRTEAEAEGHKEACQKVADEIKRLRDQDYAAAVRAVNPHDPQMFQDYAGQVASRPALHGPIIPPWIHRTTMRVLKTANDPKLSDGGAWRDGCEGGSQKGATDV